ncbi:MAG: DUF3575 domain-containing protein [Bacteroidetes bacterium]|nr:DUF3575 domain-containing protein [Bacteroidota bacterium]
MRKIFLIIFLLSAKIGFAQPSFEDGYKFGYELGSAVVESTEGIYIDNGRYFAFGAGFGQPYGNGGVKIFSRFWENWATVGLSAGLGLSSDGNFNQGVVSSGTLWSIGFQSHFGNFYLDTQVCKIAEVKTKKEEKNIIGASLHLGYNWFFHKNLGLNFSLGWVMPWIPDFDRNYEDMIWERYNKTDLGNFDWGIGISCRLPY